MRTFLRIFFHFLYHQFAFAYDFVAASVSFGHWRNWILEVVPFIEGTRTLEIGHGPGHLNRFLLDRGLVAVAMDESATMGQLAKRNVVNPPSLRGVSRSNPQTNSAQSLETEIAYPDGHTSSRRGAPLFATTKELNLTRGLAQLLPFRDESFDTVIATFPTEYITDEETLSEVKRCLSDGGRFVVLLAAMPKNRFLSWLFLVTGQASSEAMEVIREGLEEPFIESDFDVETKVIEKPSGTLIIIVATTPPR